MDDATVTLLVLAAAVALFIWNRLPVGIVALGSALALYAAGVLSVEETFAGFGSPTVVLIASLFVLSEALDASGITTWAGQRLIGAAGSDETRLVVFVLLLCAALSAVITPNGAIAALLPMMVVIATRLGRAPSKLLMPLAFSAHAGALLVLTGSPVNILVSDASAGAGAGRFGFFEFALVGVPLVAGTIVVVLTTGSRLLPERRARSLPPDLSRHARTLVEDYELCEPPVHAQVPEELFTRQVGVAEVVVPPRSELIGQPVFPGMVTDSGDLLVLAVQRQGRNVEGEAEVEAGDVLLLEGSWSALDAQLGGDEVLVVDSPGLVRRQLVPLGPGAGRTIAITVALVAALASGAVPPAVAGAVAACALVLLGVMSTEQAYRAISWTTVVLIAGLIPVSEAIRTTGAADDIAGVLVDVVGGYSPYLLLAGLFVIAAAFSVAVSNTATALILIPVALSAAADLDVAVQPVLMSVAVACSASFLTPISTPGNLIVMEPGGYRFGDYWRFGAAFLLLYFLVAVFLVPVIWPL